MWWVQCSLCLRSHWAELMEGIQLFHSHLCLGWLPWETQAVAGFTCLVLTLILAVAGTEQRDSPAAAPQTSCACHSGNIVPVGVAWQIPSP